MTRPERMGTVGREDSWGKGSEMCKAGASMELQMLEGD